MHVLFFCIMLVIPTGAVWFMNTAVSQGANNQNGVSARAGCLTERPSDIINIS